MMLPPFYVKIKDKTRLLKDKNQKLPSCGYSFSLVRTYSQLKRQLVETFIHAMNIYTLNDIIL